MAKRNYFGNTLRYKADVTSIRLMQLEDGRRAPKYTRRAKVKKLPKHTKQQIVHESLYGE